jgi:hypothetical protein
MDQEAVKEVLTAALAAVKDAKVPADLRPLAFEKAIDLLAGTATPGPAPPAGSSQQHQPTPPDLSGDARLAKIAQRTGTDTAKLAYVYDVDDDDVSVVIQRSKLSQSKAVATREIALLYAAARQAGGYDETHTSVSHIRQRVDDMGVLDEANFATAVKNVDGMTSKGSRQNREFKVTQHGYEEAGKLITRLTTTGGGP